MSADELTSQNVSELRMTNETSLVPRPHRLSELNAAKFLTWGVTGLYVSLTATVFAAALAGLLSGDLSEQARATAATIGASSSAFIYATFVMCSTWLLVSLASKIIAVHHTCSSNYKLALDFSVRLLAALPTVLLGNVLLTLLGLAGITLEPTIAGALSVPLLLTLLCLPTVIQSVRELARTVDKGMYSHARALGMSKYHAGLKLLLGQFRRSFNLAVGVGVGRVTIEAYLVYQSTSRTALNTGGSFKNWTEVSQLFKAVYATTTIQTNLVLILILFCLSLFGGWIALSVPAPK